MKQQERIGQHASWQNMPKKVNVLDNFVNWIEKNALLIALALTQNVLNLSYF